jgi:hypothetical protein
MAISNFLNPSDEEEDIQDGIPSEDEVLQKVIDEYLGLQQTQDDDEEELQLERSLYSVKSARQALQVLIEFTEEQEALQSDYLRGILISVLYCTAYSMYSSITLTTYDLTYNLTYEGNCSPSHPIAPNEV